MSLPLAVRLLNEPECGIVSLRFSVEEVSVQRLHIRDGNLYLTVSIVLGRSGAAEWNEIE